MEGDLNSENKPAPSFYDILGIDKDTPTDELKKAFRKKARENHPDLNKNDSSAEGRFKEINTAYEALSDDQRRYIYDTYGPTFYKGLDTGSVGWSKFRETWQSYGEQEAVSWANGVITDSQRKVDISKQKFEEQRRRKEELDAKQRQAAWEAQQKAQRVKEIPQNPPSPESIPDQPTSRKETAKPPKGIPEQPRQKVENTNGATPNFSDVRFEEQNAQGSSYEPTPRKPRDSDFGSSEDVFHAQPGFENINMHDFTEETDEFEHGHQRVNWEKGTQYVRDQVQPTEEPTQESTYGFFDSIKQKVKDWTDDTLASAYDAWIKDPKNPEKIAAKKQAEEQKRAQKQLERETANQKKQEEEEAKRLEQLRIKQEQEAREAEERFLKEQERLSKQEQIRSTSDKIFEEQEDFISERIPSANTEQRYVTQLSQREDSIDATIEDELEKKRLEKAGFLKRRGFLEKASDAILKNQPTDDVERAKLEDKKVKDFDEKIRQIKEEEANAGLGGRLKNRILNRLFGPAYKETKLGD